MPAYNCGRFVDEAIRSVIAQTFAAWELIVVDDGSTDDTLKRLSNHAAADTRIQVIRMKQNSGGRAAVPKNAAIQSARGRLVAFLDADDVWMPEKLAMQIQQFEETKGLVFSYTLYSLKRPDGSISGLFPKRHHRYRGAAFHNLFVNCVIPNSGIMLPKSAFDEWGLLDEDPSITEDGDLVLRLAKRGPIDYVGGPALMIYRVVKDSDSRNVIRSWKRAMGVLRKHSAAAGPSLFLMGAVVNTAYSVFRLANRFFGGFRSDLN